MDLVPVLHGPSALAGPLAARATATLLASRVRLGFLAGSLLGLLAGSVLGLLAGSFLGLRAEENPVNGAARAAPFNVAWWGVHTWTGSAAAAEAVGNTAAAGTVFGAGAACTGGVGSAPLAACPCAAAASSTAMAASA